MGAIQGEVVVRSNDPAVNPAAGTWLWKWCAGCQAKRLQHATEPPKCWKCQGDLQ